MNPNSATIIVEESDCVKTIGTDNGIASYKTDEKEKQDIQTQPVREIDVGITEYISKHEGFHGVIKQRYTN